MKKIALALFAMLFIWACASSPAVKDDNTPKTTGDTRIITDPHSVYPPDDYLTAVGKGDNRRDAEQDAMGALTRIFKSEIKVDSQSRQAYKNLVGGEGGNLSSMETEIVQNVSVRAGQDLINVKFSEAVVDQMGTVHIIAFLDKQETGKIYQGLIRKNNERVENYLAKSRANDDLLGKYAMLNAAYIISQANEILIEQLTIINSKMLLMIQPETTIADIESMKLDLQQEMAFRIEIAGDEDGQVSTFVREELGKIGFPASDNGILAVQGNVSLKATGASEEYKSITWSLSLSLADESGRIISTIEKTNRERALDEDTARVLTMKTIKEVVKKELMPQVFDFFNELVK